MLHSLFLKRISFYKLSLSTELQQSYSRLVREACIIRDPGPVAFSTNEKAAGSVFFASIAHDKKTERNVFKKKLYMSHADMWKRKQDCKGGGGGRVG